MDRDSVRVDDRAELEDLRARLAEAEETIRAIRHGEVDALLIADGAGERVYTLRSADAPYRALVEQMQGGAVTVSSDGDVIYCNQYFAALVDAPLQQVIGAPIDQFVDVADQPYPEVTARRRVRERFARASVAGADRSTSVSRSAPWQWTTRNTAP